MAEQLDVAELAKELDLNFELLKPVLSDLNARLDALAEQNAQLEKAIAEREKALYRLENVWLN